MIIIGFKEFCNSLYKTFDINIHRSLSHRWVKKQGRKRPLDTPKRMIERREREGEI